MSGIFSNSNNIGVLSSGFAYGAAKGYLAKREDDRAQSDQDMQVEEFGWKREAVEKEKNLQLGMARAAQDGGYEGVITFLEKADPERALKFNEAKLSLDDHIMSNDVMKYAAEYKKQEIMVESYGLLGKMGKALLDAPEEVRGAMYEQMLPIVKKINPNAPGDLQSAVPMFMLSVAQATSANQTFKAEKSQITAESNIGRLDVDIRSRLDAGMSPNDPTIVAMQANRDKYVIDSQKAVMQLTKAQTAQSTDALKNSEMFSKNLATASKDFLNFADSYSALNASLETMAKTEPGSAQNTVAAVALQRDFAMSKNKGAFSEADAAIGLSAYGLPSVEKKVLSMMNGQVEHMTKDEIKVLTDYMYNLKNQKIMNQKAIEGQFEQSASDWGTHVDWDNVRKPSERFAQYQQQVLNQNTVMQGDMPPELQAAVAKGKQNGYSDAEIQQVVQTYMQKQAQGAQQRTNPDMNPADYGVGQ